MFQLIIFFATLYPLLELSLKQFTYKLIALIAFATAPGAQTMSALNMNYMSIFFFLCFSNTVAG